MVGPFPWDEDGNNYLLVPTDPFSKWVEAHAVPLVHSWRATKFLYDDLVAYWRQVTPHPDGQDSGAKFVGSFAHGSIKGLAFIHHPITIGNSKGNGQAEGKIWSLKDCIQRGLDKGACTSFWMNQVASASAAAMYDGKVQMTMGIALLLTGCGPSAAATKLDQIPGLPLLPDQPTPDDEETYLA